MDVYQASANMIAFSEFMVVAAKSAFGPQVKTKAEVAGFGRGSFITHLVFEMIGPAATIFSAISPEQLLEIVNESFKVWKHLKGEPPKSVQHTNNQTARITNNNGQVIQVQTQTLNVVFNEKASDAVKQFVQGPLTANGIDSLAIETANQNVIAEAKQTEAAFFTPVIPSQAITDTTVTMTLILEAPVFKEDNKWRFSDGQSSIYVDVIDREFLAKVDAGESFAKGDLLTVDLRITQQRSGMKITTERAITKVHEHKRGAEQGALFLN